MFIHAEPVSFKHDNAINSYNARDVNDPNRASNTITFHRIGSDDLIPVRLLCVYGSLNS